MSFDVKELHARARESSAPWSRRSMLLLLASIALLSTACTTQNGAGIPEDFVSVELVDRVEIGLPTGGSAEGLDLPPPVSLEDGLSDSEAVAVALWNSARFHADLAGLGLARADLVDARLLPNPVLSLIFPGTSALREGTLSVPLRLLQRRSRIAIASLNLERTANALIQSGLGLVRDVRIAYAELRAAREREALSSNNAELLREISEIADEQARAGQISEMDASRAELDWLTAVADLQDARRQSGAALNRLLALLGVAEYLEDVTLEGPEAVARESPALDRLITAALASRPDMRAAELAVDAAAENAHWQKQQALDLVALLDLDQQEGGDLNTGPGFQISLPVFDRNQGGRRRATVELEQSALRYRAVRQRIIAEVRESYVAYETALAAEQAWREQIVPTAERVVEQTVRAFNVGSIAELSVLLARQRLLAARLSEADTRLELERAAASLAHSIGQRLDRI